MKILILTHSPKHQSNPYVGTLSDAVALSDPSVHIDFGYRHFWTSRAFAYDIVHCMWPDVLKRGGHSLADIGNRLEQLHERGVRIVSTCHNLVAHVAQADDAYHVIYSHSDAIFHLGPYSYNLLQQQYPQASHVCAFHHIYDTLYPTDTARCQPSGKVASRVVCIGDFRTDAERQMLLDLAQQMPDIDFTCPSYCRSWWEVVKCRWSHRLPSNLHASHGKLSDKALIRLCQHSDILLVQRVKTLNSGNVTLGFIFGLVVTGPDTGNVGPLLHDNGCPTFDPSSTDSMVQAVRKAQQLACDNYGHSIQQAATSKYSTKAAAQQMLDCYRSLL